MWRDSASKRSHPPRPQDGRVGHMPAQPTLSESRGLCNDRAELLTAFEAAEAAFGCEGEVRSDGTPNEHTEDEWSDDVFGSGLSGRSRASLRAPSRASTHTASSAAAPNGAAQTTTHSVGDAAVSACGGHTAGGGVRQQCPARTRPEGIAQELRSCCIRPDNFAPETTSCRANWTDEGRISVRSGRLWAKLGGHRARSSTTEVNHSQRLFPLRSSVAPRADPPHSIAVPALAAAPPVGPRCQIPLLTWFMKPVRPIRFSSR